MKAKRLLLIVLMLTPYFAKSLVLIPYTGISITKGNVGQGYIGKGSNWFAGLRLDHEMFGGLQLGIGIDLQKLSFREKRTGTDINAQPITFDYSHLVGSPAISGYVHAAYRFKISKFSIIPGLIAGAAYCNKGSSDDANSFTYPSAPGYLLGGSLGLEYGFKRLAIHSEFMPRYYKFSYGEKYIKELEAKSYNISLGVSIKI